MKKKHIIVKRSFDGIPGSEVWDDIPQVEIDCYPWNENNYMPRTYVKIFYTDTHFHLRFRAYEDEIRAVMLNMNDMVCRDSCVEFFFKPKPASDARYFNFEMNPIGTLLIGMGSGRHDISFVRVDDPFKTFSIVTSVNRDSVAEYRGPFWEVQYSIPYSFIEGYFGKLDFHEGYRLLGNFYKCGDQTRNLHYGCWNPIEVEAPDFHRPEFFGELVLGF